MSAPLESIDDLLYVFTQVLTYFFKPSGQGSHYLADLVSFIVDEPLIMAVIGIFFVGAVFAIFFRAFHSS